MATSIDLSLEQKVNLIKDNEQGMSSRQLRVRVRVFMSIFSIFEENLHLLCKPAVSKIIL